jgi:hypothetical protein
MRRRTRAALVGLAAGSLAAWAITRADRLRVWGATEWEQTAPMPGDEIVGEGPLYRSTRAVEVDAPPDQVWPWLVQLGQGRGGLHSYDWLENLVGLDIHSADEIVPALQDLSVGDEVRLTPPGTEPDLVFRMVRIEAPSLLVLGPSGTQEEAFSAGLPYPVWTFAVNPHPGGRSRLVVRFQLQAPETRANRVVYGHLLGGVHFVMERRMLLGIKERAERTARRGS